MAIDPMQRHLIRMNDLYQSACQSFADGDLSAEEARRAVLDLSYTDPEGRTWRVDTMRSGHMAAFTDGTTHLTLSHHLAEPEGLQLSESISVSPPEPPPEPPTEPIAAPIPDRVYARTAVRRRLKPMLTALGLTAALAAIPVVYLASTHRSAQKTDAVSPVVPTNEVDPGASATAPAATTPGTPGTTTSGGAPAITIEGKTIDQIPFDTEVVFGQSVRGRPLVVERRGDVGGVRVLVVGVIHGNEQAGLQVVKLLQSMDVGTGVDLWLVPMVNPDGVAANTRQNANGVDLNRNFPNRWRAVGEPGYWEYSGTAAATEPEVRATMSLSELIQPDFVVWYHQDYFRISPTTGRAGAIRARYAALVDLPLLTISGGTYAGTAGSWVTTVVAPQGTSLTVEFGKSLRTGEAQANADAILTVAHEFWITAQNDTPSGP